MGRVNWFEVHADDVKRAAAFYGKALGWKIEKWGNEAGYLVAATGDDTVPGINGAIMKRMGPNSVWVMVTVGDIDDAMRMVVEAGGAIAQPKREITGVGWVAYCVDTEGNVFGLHQNPPGIGV